MRLPEKSRQPVIGCRRPTAPLQTPQQEVPANRGRNTTPRNDLETQRSLPMNFSSTLQNGARVFLCKGQLMLCANLRLVPGTPGKKTDGSRWPTMQPQTEESQTILPPSTDANKNYRTEVSPCNHSTCQQNNTYGARHRQNRRSFSRGADR